MYGICQTLGDLIGSKH